MRKLLGAIGALILVLLLAQFLMSKTPVVQVSPAVKAIGMSTPVPVKVDSAHGVRVLTAHIEQDGRRFKVFEERQPSRRNSLFRDTQPARNWTIPVGKQYASDLRDGNAILTIEATANDMAGSTATWSGPVDVITRPPMVSADGAQHYINQGGSELVTFTASGYWTEAGVRVGKYTFRSFPMPGKTDPNSSERFSLFAFPWDVPADTVPIVYAKNPSGAEATARFWFKVFPKQFRSRDLQLDDAFLQKAVSELDPNGSGELVDRFVKINSEMRRENNKYLADLRFKTEPKLLWQGPFFRIGKVESFFADQRSYLYKGKKIDQQMHLGFDLSDVQAAPVKAANAGKVIHAGPLGIYGNCVVVDHGYGLQSIYGHMRQIDVKVGDAVTKEQVMGRSGATGLAGGDHIHYSIQVDGVQVNPVEWWDDHWIRDRILSKIGGANQQHK
jgi:murein DD-endopeptidase MepM/ murein hydrolase activator NlpD